MACYLPEEMIMEVLIRLPVKSLVRCKSVCKPWLSTISSPKFIKSHLHRAIIASENNPTLLEIEEPLPSNEEEEPTLVDPDEDLLADIEQELPDEDLLLQIEQEVQLRHQHLFEALVDVNGQDLSTSPIRLHRFVMPCVFSVRYVIIGSCYNGILCVANKFDYENYLWNPSIKQCKKLPTPPPSYNSELIQPSFGYDSISDDYLVFRFVYNMSSNVIVPMLQLYSSNSDSWTQFHPFTGQNKTVLAGATIVINGILYFPAGKKLVLFDLRKQAFVLVPFPSSVRRMISNVLDFNGSVAIVFQSGSQAYLWTLDDVSGEVSWTKRFNIEADLKLMNVYFRCYLGAGQFYGIKSINRMFLYGFLYDYEKKVTKYYRLGEDPSFPTFNYMETLVSLNGFKKVERMPPDSVSLII